jgi:hypothetical protein
MKNRDERAEERKYEKKIRREKKKRDKAGI